MARRAPPRLSRLALFAAALLAAAVAAAQDIEDPEAPLPDNYEALVNASAAAGPPQALLGAATVAAGDVVFPNALTPENQPGATDASIAALKAKFDAAAADPDAAFTAHISGLTERRVSLVARGRDLPAHLAMLGDGADVEGMKAAFKANLKSIAKLNAKSRTAAYGITPFTHMTKEQFKATLLGGKKRAASGAAGRAAVINAAFTCVKATDWKVAGLAKSAPPTAIDWRALGAVTPVRDQGSCGSCVTFANVAAMEAAYIYTSKVANTSSVDLAEQDALNCFAGDGCQGAYGYEYIDNTICKQIAFEAKAKYTATDKDQCSSTVARTGVPIKGYSFIPGNVKAFRQALAHNVIAVGIDAGDSDGFMSYVGGILPCGGKAMLDHEVAIVAYAEGVQPPNKPATKKGWKVYTIKNSWGADWGEAGFIRVRADCGGAGALGMYRDKYAVLPLRSA